MKHLFQFQRIVSIISLIAAHITYGQSLLDKGPCQTWYPLGANGEDHSTLPYNAHCSPTPDGTQIIMEVITHTGMPFGGIIATAVRKDNKAWTSVGSFAPPAEGYTIVDCLDASQSVVKDDFSNATVFRQAWNVPLNDPEYSLENVRCRYLIAQTDQIFWNDVLVDAGSSVLSQLVTEAPKEAENGPASDNAVIAAQNSNASADNSSLPSAATNSAANSTESVSTTPVDDVMLLKPKQEKMNLLGEEISYWCGTETTRFVIKKGSECSEFIMAIITDVNEYSPLQQFQCAPNTRFSTDTCACTWFNEFGCPSELA